MEKLGGLHLSLKEAFPETKTNGGPIAIPPELPLIFHNLIDAFDELDFMAIENEMKNLDELEEVNTDGFLKEQIESIKDSVLVMDYDGAEKIIRKILESDDI